MNFKNVNCPLCNSNQKKLLYKGKSIKNISKENFKCTSEDLAVYNNIYKCKNCDMIYQSPILNSNVIIDMYKNIRDPKYLKKKGERTRTFENYVNLIKRFLRKDSKILEIGSYTGVFLKLMKDQNFMIEGLELSDWARGISKENINISVYKEELREFCKKRNELYDGICLWDVIEHYDNPIKELQFMNKILKKDGYLFLYTVDAGSSIFTLLGKRYPFLMIMHLVYFSRKTIRKALEKRGFKVILIKRHKRYISKKYLFNRFDIIFGSFSLIFKKIVALYFDITKKEFIPIDFMGLMDVVAKKT